MNKLERRVIENIDHEEMLQYISEMISVPSYSGEETTIQLNVASKLETLGLDVDTWEIDFDKLKVHPDFSMSYSREEGLGVVGSTGQETGGRSLILCGHVDTVAPGDPENWSTPALKATLKDGRLYGRGSADMKGGVACGIYALKAIMDAGVQLKGRVHLESVIGEEDGGCGALATCLRGYRADAGIIMEPSELKLAPEVAGAMSFTVTVPGKSAHACMREEGVSAIDKFQMLHEGLKKLEAERNSRVDDPLYSRYRTPYAISVGKIEGGEWAGTVPERVVFEGRMGVAVGETEGEARRELESKIDEVSQRDPWLKENKPTVDWVGYSFASSKIPVNHPIVETIGNAFREVTYSTATIEGMTYASDVRHLINVGKTPTMVFGPGDIRVAHGPNEYVPLKDLEITVKTLALTILRFVGYNG